MSTGPKWRPAHVEPAGLGPAARRTERRVSVYPSDRSEIWSLTSLDARQTPAPDAVAAKARGSAMPVEPVEIKVNLSKPAEAVDTLQLTDGQPRRIYFL